MNYKNTKHDIRITELVKAESKLNPNPRGIINLRWENDTVTKLKELYPNIINAHPIKNSIMAHGSIQTKSM